jgi:hypothetical protein
MVLPFTIYQSRASGPPCKEPYVTPLVGTHCARSWWAQQEETPRVMLYNMCCAKRQNHQQELVLYIWSASTQLIPTAQP